MNAPKLTGNRCQCTACGEYFNGVQPFDRHRIGQYGIDRRCLAIAEMEAAGFIRNVSGFWCERASEEHAMRPRAPGFAAPRTATAMQHPCPTASAPEYARAGTP